MLEIFENFGQIIIRAAQEIARGGKKYLLYIIKELNKFDRFVVVEVLE